MYNPERVVREMIVTGLESLAEDEFKDFLIQELNELDENDFNEVVKKADKNIISKISQWHKDRKITINGSSAVQTIKLGEEYGELCSGIVRGNKDLIKDSIGDMVVVLVAIAELEGFTFNECVEAAYEEIKDRKGYLNEMGNFIKEGDE